MRTLNAFWKFQYNVLMEKLIGTLPGAHLKFNTLLNLGQCTCRGVWQHNFTSSF